MKGRRLFAIPPPLEGDEHTLLVSFCIPNTHGWRSAATALLSQFDYGRAYDEDTGSVLGALEVGKEIFNSMSMCDLDEMTRAIRQLTAVIGGLEVDLTEPIPDNLNYTDVEFGLIPTLHEHLQSLGPIPKAGDTIMTSLQKLAQSQEYAGLTLEDLIDQINEFEPGVFDRWKDYLEVLSFMSDIFPGTTRVDIVGDFFEKLSLARYRHNDLTIKGYQATALRGIMRGIAPFEDDPETEETNLLEKLGSIPWLGKAAIALVEPTPGGEAWLAASTVAQVVTSVFTKIQAAWANWFNNWTDQVETPVPSDNVTTAISSLAGVLGGLGPTSDEGGGQNVVDLGAALLQISSSISSISQKCSFCGSSVGCDCEGIGGIGPTDNLPEVEDYEEGDPAPVGYDTPTDLPGTSGYQSRRCKIANIVHSTMSFIMTTLGSKTAEIAAAKSLPAALGLALMVTVVAAILGEVATPVPVIDALIVSSAALALAIATYLIGQDVVFGPLNAALSSREEDLVCALYEATSIGDARVNYNNVLISEGVSTVAAGLASLVISAQFATLLFLDVETLGPATDIALSGYSGPIDCASCGVGPFTLVRGTLQSGALDEATFVVRARAINGFYEVHLLTPATGCVEVEYTYSSGPVGGSCGSLGPGNTSGWAFDCDTELNVLGQITPTFPPSNFSYCATPNGARWLRLRSCATFDLTIERGGGCE